MEMWNGFCSCKTGIPRPSLSSRILLEKYNSLSDLKGIHAVTIVVGLSNDDSFLSRILSFSALSVGGDIDYAYKVLLHLSNPTTFDWSTVVRGYSQSRNPNKSVSVFIAMLRFGAIPDHLTYPFLTKASARVSSRELGVSIHAHIAKHGYECDRFVANSLIHMYASFSDVSYARKVFDAISVKNLVSWNSMMDGYAKCKNFDLAHELFDVMPERDVVSWSSLIDGCVKNARYEEAISIFDQMRVLGPKANEVTMVSVLSACAHLGSLDHGRTMHLYISDNRLPLTMPLRTVLVDMYAKCGAIEEALVIFRGGLGVPSDVFIWNAIIGGLATNGRVKESLDFFTKMQLVGIKPDEITYLCLLSACAHGGLVKQAWHFFQCLFNDGMMPKSEHYACVVDVMARAGQVREAYEFVSKMPIQPSASTLGALVSGCISHGKLDLAAEVGRNLVQLQPDHDGRYIGLSNVYAIFKHWDKARSLREAMERRGLKKAPGYSSVELWGTQHRFTSHDKSHPISCQIYVMLCFIDTQMKHGVFRDNQDCYDMPINPVASWPIC